MKKYVINPVTGAEEELIMEPSSKDAGNIEVLKRNVKELQQQLNTCQVRIMELNEELSTSRNQGRVLEEEIRKALEIPNTI
jgi:chromosome segregation ATPase